MEETDKKKWQVSLLFRERTASLLLILITKEK